MVSELLVDISNEEELDQDRRLTGSSKVKGVHDLRQRLQPELRQRTLST